MKTRVLFRLLLVAGLFGLININLLAQEVVVSTGEASTVVRARESARAEAREHASQYILVSTLRTNRQKSPESLKLKQKFKG